MKEAELDGGAATTTTTATMVIPTTVITEADVIEQKDDAAVGSEKKDEGEKEEAAGGEDIKPEVAKDESSAKPSDADKPKEVKKDEKNETLGAPQPIFKPLTSDKGKSKSSGRTIGGWL